MPKEVTLWGIVIASNLLHRSNALIPMEVKPSGKDTDVSAVQARK